MGDWVPGKPGPWGRFQVWSHVRAQELVCAPPCRTPQEDGSLWACALAGTGESWELLDEGGAGVWCPKACPGIAPPPVGPWASCLGQGLPATMTLHLIPGPDGRTPPFGEHAGATGTSLAGTVPGCAQPSLRRRPAFPHHPSR